MDMMKKEIMELRPFLEKHENEIARGDFKLKLVFRRVMKRVAEESE